MTAKFLKRHLWVVMLALFAGLVAADALTR